MPNYIPNSQNIPLMNKKGELKSEFSLTNFHFSYSLTNHIGLAMNYFMKNKPDKIIHFFTNHDSYSQKLNIRESELALGLFNATDRFIFELFTGTGYGNISYSFWDNYNYKITSKPVKFYIQSDFAFKYENVAIALSIKFLNYRFTKETYMTTNKFENIYFLSQHEGLIVPDFNTELHFAQPAVTFHYKLFDYLYLNVQYGRNISMYHHNSTTLNSLNFFENYFCDFAVGVNISDLFKKLKNPDKKENSNQDSNF
jgi:hypothetical protein